jgi:hypothetical protein
MHNPARMLLAGLLAVASLTVFSGPSVETQAFEPATTRTRTVYLGGNLNDEAILSLGAAAAHSGAILLLDSPTLTPHLRHFLSDYQPERIIPVGEYPEGQAGLTRRLGMTVEPVVPWSPRACVCPLWSEHLPRPAKLVVCPPTPRAQLLKAALLAARQGSPLWISREDDLPRLERFVRRLSIGEVLQVGPTRSVPVGVKVVPVSRPDGHAAPGKMDTIVVVNPADTGPGLGGMAVLAPWLAASKRGTLLLTNPKGDNVASLVEASAKRRATASVDSLILLGNLKAIPVWQRPNPIPGDKDKVIDLEPLTPTSGQAISYAIGRLFHEDRAVIPLMLARQRLVREKPGPRRALVASNPGGGLSMLEAFSRTTAHELRNGGYQVTGLFGRDLNAPILRKEMPRHDVILWEGHHNTLIKDWGFLSWDEPLPASFVFLQSCLALMPEKVEPLLSRGAYAVVGTSTRTYSASGGAFSLAYHNALLYDDQSLGGALRSAKNFLFAYAMLKERRLGDQASRTGANLRAAWAFSLWGDPTFKLPQPAMRTSPRPAVRHDVEGNEIIIDVPRSRHEKVSSDRYRVLIPPNGRLAGLVDRKGEEGDPVVPLIFAEVRLPERRAGGTPRLRSRLSASKWVFLWDARRRTGYLLAMPRAVRDADTDERLRFRIEWQGVRVAGREE